MNLLVISNKRYETDFRKYLMQAAESEGVRAAHLYAWEEFVITFEGREIAHLPGVALERDVYEKVCLLFEVGPVLVLTGLGGRISNVALKAKHHLANALFVFDIYDDFRYGARGRAFFRWMLDDLRWRFHTDLSIVLNKDLKCLYPNAYHLNNASHLKPLTLSASNGVVRLVYIGSIDVRVDWQWLHELALQETVIDIYGQVHLGNAEIASQLDQFLRTHDNVNFLGPYDNNDLANILSQYRIGIVPYKVKYALTKFINPDKFYHYLNAGLEVVTTGFPQALYLASYVHVMNEPYEWPIVLQRICVSPLSVHWPMNKHTWEFRWQELRDLALSKSSVSE